MSTDIVPKNVVDCVFSEIRGRAPWTVHAEWAPKRRIDRGRLAAAAAATVREHPLLSARQSRDHRSWHLSERPLDQAWAMQFDTVTNEDTVAAARDAAISGGFDLSGEPPVRFVLIRGPSHDRAVVVADHAVVDGIGIGRTLLSLLSHYAQGSCGTDSVRVDTAWKEAQALAVRPLSEWSRKRRVELLLEQSRPTVVRLAPEVSRADNDRNDSYGIVYHEPSQMALAALAEVPLGVWGGSVNDVVVAGFCLACMRWNRARGVPSVPLSVGVPVNLRPARHWFEGVCNATLPWPVRLDHDDPGHVVHQIARQLAGVRIGVYSADVRAVLGYVASRDSVPLRIRHALATTTVVSTVTVPPDEVPDGCDGRLYGGAPAPAAMGVTFGVVIAPGGMCYSARFLRSRYTHGGVSRLLSSVDDQIVRLCGVVSGVETGESADRAGS